jgi:hypothetical protein
MAFPDDDLDVIVEAYLGADPNDAPGTWPAATDLSSRLIRKPIQIRRGRGKNQKTAQAGSCTLWLDNSDGALTPLLATSTYYPNWDLGVPLRVRVDNVGNSPPYVRHAGFVAEIKAVMVPGPGGVNLSAVQVTSAGVLRRISQGAVAKSPLRRSIPYYSPGAYWPMEDGVNAGYFGSGLPSGAPLAVTTADFASTDDLLGSAELAEFTATTALIGEVDYTFTGTEWSMIWFAKFPAVLGGLATLLDVSTPGGTAIRWVVAADATTVYLTGYDATGASVFSTTNTTTVFNAMFNGQWIGIGLEADSSSTGSMVVEVYNLTGFRNGFGVTGVTLIGSPRAFRVPASTRLVGMAMGHLAAIPDTGPAYVWPGGGSGGVTAAAGYAGEQAHARVLRNCAEEGITYSGNSDQSNECGPQPIGDITDVLQDAEAVDHGMLIEDFAFGLDYRSSSQRENLTAAITVDLSTYRTSAETQDDVLTPVRNDARIRNEWTISRPDGATKTANDPAHIALRGRYNDSATVGVRNDDRILDEAQWRVREGTFEGLRYESVPLDLAANE